MTLRDDILAQTDIVDLVSRYVQLKKVGKNRSWLCPFHREKTPSFTVAEDKQIFKCFGCGKGGNAITFQMEIEKIDFRDSVKILAKSANIDITKYQKDPEEMTKQQEGREKIKLLNKRVQTWFQEQFKPDSKAWTYIHDKRKITDATIAAFGIGYAPDSHYDLLTYLKEKWFTLDDMIQAWVAKKGNSGDAYAFFRERVTFPIYDHIWNIVGFGARALDADQTPKYLNTTETPIYDKSSVLFGLDKAKNYLQDFGTLVIVEGYMDVIALHQYGIPVWIATCGTALTPQHVKLIKRHTDKVLFSFDNDHAGFEAVIRWLKVAYQQDLFPKVFQFPAEYKDVDEYLTSLSHEVNNQLLNDHSIDAFTFVLRSLSQQYDVNNPVERKKVLNTCFELLANIEDYTILVLYLDQMAKLFQTSTDGLLHQLKGFLKQQRTSNLTNHEEQTEEKWLENKYILASLYYKDFLKEEAGTHPRIQLYLDCISTFSNFFPDSLISQVVANKELSDKDQQHLLEAHIRREQQTNKLIGEKKTLAYISFLQGQLHVLEKVILKSKTLTHDQKQEILSQVKQLKSGG